MDNTASHEDDSLLLMQKEMQDLKQRESELARKIAQANRQKSMSKGSVGDLREPGIGRARSVSPRVSSLGDSPTRDYFHGRNIESKVGKYIRGEDKYTRKSNGVGSKANSSTKSHSTSPSTRYGRGIRASSSPDYNNFSWRQDTPRRKSYTDAESKKHKSTPNLSTIDDLRVEEMENLSDDEGKLRSRSKRKVIIEKAISTGNLDEVDIPENNLVDTSDPEATTSSVSIEIQKIESMQNPVSENLIDFDSNNRSEHQEQTQNASDLSFEDFHNEEEQKSSNNTGSAIDIDSILWSGNTTKEEDEQEVEPAENVIERKISWNPEDIIIGDESPGKSGGQRSIFRSSKMPPLNWTSEESISDDLTSENFRNDGDKDDNDGDESSEEVSARELILDAKSKIEREIEELQKREEELRNMRQQGPERRMSEGERSTGDEEFYEAKESLVTDTKGLIQKELEESEKREMEYKNIQKLIYGESAISNKIETESDEDDTDETTTITPSASFDGSSRGKIEKEMVESLRRETEHQNRLTKVTPSQKSMVKKEVMNEKEEEDEVEKVEEEQEEQSSEGDEEEVKATVDAVTKIELEIEDIRKREEELKKMRHGKDKDDTVEREVIHSEMHEVEEDLSLDPIRKIEMEIEQDRRRDLELKQRYGIDTETEERSEVKENGVIESEHEEEKVEVVQEAEVVISIEEPVQQSKSSGPGRVRIPDAFQSIARRGHKSVTEASEPLDRPKSNLNHQATRDLSVKHRAKSAESIMQTTKVSRVRKMSREDILDERSNQEAELIYKTGEEDGVMSDDDIKENLVSARASAPEFARIDYSDLDTVRSGFTKEKIYLFDPDRKPKSPKVKENKITKAKKKFEKTETKLEQQGQGNNSHENRASGNVKNSVTGAPLQRVRRLSAEFQELEKTDSQSHGGKKYVLRKRGSAKSKRDNTSRPEVRSQVDGWEGSEYDQEYNKLNGNGLRNGGTRHGPTKFKQETDSDEVLLGRSGKKETLSGESEVEVYGRHVERQRRTLESLNSQKAQAISREQLKKRDAMIKAEIQREKRRSMAELWQKNMVNREDLGDSDELMTAQVETIEKFQAQSPWRSEGSLKTSALKSSAQRRVQQWEQLIASRGHISSK